jgi:hypothetical protein
VQTGAAKCLTLACVARLHLNVFDVEPAGSNSGRLLHNDAMEEEVDKSDPAPLSSLCIA